MGAFGRWSMGTHNSVCVIHRLAPQSEMCLDAAMRAAPFSRHLSDDDAAKVRKMVELHPLEVEGLIREVAGIWKNVSPLDRPYYEACGNPEFISDRRSRLKAHVLDRVAAIAVSTLDERAEDMLLKVAQRFFARIELACGVELSVKVIALGKSVRLQESKRLALAKRGFIVASSRDDREFLDLSADQVANLYVRRTCALAYAISANIERLSACRGDESPGSVG